MARLTVVGPFGGLSASIPVTSRQCRAIDRGLYAIRTRADRDRRLRLSAGGNRIRTCMGLFLSSHVFGFFVRSGKAVPRPSPAIRFAERAEGVKGPKR
jgi:hypothetical protein